MGLTDYRLDILTDESGDATVTGDTPILGLLESIVWVDGTLADGVDAVISLTSTPEGVDKTLLTLTNANDDAEYPLRQSNSDNTGSDLSSHSRITVRGKPKVVVSSGGNAATGAVVLYYHKFT